MKPKTFVGLDVHRNLVVATALNAAGKQIRQTSFGPSPKDLVQFLRRLPKPVKAVLEASSVWERYYEAAKSAGVEIVISHPRTTRMIAEASLKTDKVDSATLANLLRLNSIPLVYIPNPEVRALRHLYLDRRFYTRTRTTIVQHAYSRLGQHGIDYKHNALQRKSRRDRFRSLGIPEVNLALDAVDDFERRCVEIDARIHESFVGSEEAQLLATIPGVGEASAVGLVGYVCPVSRFQDAGKLTSYAGLCPTTHQSSDTLFHGHLKPDCNRGFRGLLIEASWRHRIHEPEGDVARCASRVARTKGRMHGTIAGAHKLLRIIYAILKQRRAYRRDAPAAQSPRQSTVEVTPAPRISKRSEVARSKAQRISVTATKISRSTPKGLKSSRRIAMRRGLSTVRQPDSASFHRIHAPVESSSWQRLKEPHSRPALTYRLRYATPEQLRGPSQSK